MNELRHDPLCQLWLGWTILIWMLGGSTSVSFGIGMGSFFAFMLIGALWGFLKNVIQDASEKRP